MNSIRTKYLLNSSLLLHIQKKLIKLESISNRHLHLEQHKCYKVVSISSPVVSVPQQDHENDNKSSKSKLPWKDAASIILVAPSTDSNGLSQFLIMKRSKGSNFLPNSLCFPGGQSSIADFHFDWIEFFRYFGATDITKVQFLSKSAQLPIMYGAMDPELDSRKQVKHMFKKFPIEVSIRITAIREMFEECGILLCKIVDKSNFGKGFGRDSSLPLGKQADFIAMQDPDEIEEWQMKVKKDPMEFLNLCKHYKCLPDLNALTEWSDWLTPNSFGIKRFDTMFYMALLPHPVPYLIDEFEVDSAQWSTANDVLAAGAAGKTRLIPPQIYELTRLRNTKFDKLGQLMKMRTTFGVERWCPCYFNVDDGVLSVFPGDDLYPKDYKLAEFEDIRELPKTIEELRKSTTSHHRIEFKSEYDFNLLVNLSPRNGQIYLN